LTERDLPLPPPLFLDENLGLKREKRLEEFRGFAEEGDSAFITLMEIELGLRDGVEEDSIDYESVSPEIIEICKIGYQNCIDKKLDKARLLSGDQGKVHKRNLIYAEVRGWRARAKKLHIPLNDIEKEISEIERQCDANKQKPTELTTEVVTDEIRSFFKFR